MFPLLERNYLWKALCPLEKLSTYISAVHICITSLQYKVALNVFVWWLCAWFKKQSCQPISIGGILVHLHQMGMLFYFPKRIIWPSCSKLSDLTKIATVVCSGIYASKDQFVCGDALSFKSWRVFIVFKDPHQREWEPLMMMMMVKMMPSLWWQWWRRRQWWWCRWVFLQGA